MKVRFNCWKCGKDNEVEVMPVMLIETVTINPGLKSKEHVVSCKDCGARNQVEE